jgi:rod shape-determining protein MreC
MKQYINYEEGSKNGLSIYNYINSFFKKIEFIILIIVCLTSIIISKNNKNFIDKISLYFVEISLPISHIISSPFKLSSDMIFSFKELSLARSENRFLKKENERLKSIYIKALNISQENKELSGLLKFIKNKSLKYQSVRLITNSSHSYSNNIIINAGKNDGIEENNVIISEESIIGRVFQVGDNISRVLTINNENSKIPVITSNSREKGILSGNNSKIMTIDYLEKNHKIKVGDFVYTSGDGEYLQPGLLIGKVVKVKNKHVEVIANQNPNSANLAVISKY